MDVALECGSPISATLKLYILITVDLAPLKVTSPSWHSAANNIPQNLRRDVYGGTLVPIPRAKLISDAPCGLWRLFSGISFQTK